MKQVLVMRADLGMSPGKLAAQAAHAAILSYNKALRNDIDEWERTGITKIVLAVNSEQELISVYKKAVAEYLPCAIVSDEGRTEVEPGTITGFGIGPANNVAIDRITGHLKLYGKEITGKEHEVITQDDIPF